MTTITPETATPDEAMTEDDPLAGTPYRFIAHLGRGGMGEVVEAEHIALGHRVAIKLLLAEYFARFELKDRTRLEAQAGARVRHDNLVPVSDFGETLDGRVFIVMERLHGRSLGEELQARGFLPVAEAVGIARQALAGLAAAHAAGLVHRDIKPDNLFLCDTLEGTRRVKVLDFGIAKIVDAATTPQTPAPLAQATAEGMTVGTPRYASPEQSRGDRGIDARSDIYSMGWVLNTMLTGKVPFPNLKTAGELARAHNNETPPLPSAVAPQPVPGELDMVVLRAISKQPEDRFANAEALRAALGPFVGQAVGNGAVLNAPMSGAQVTDGSVFGARVFKSTELMAPRAGVSASASVATPAVEAHPATVAIGPPGMIAGSPGPGETVDASQAAITRPVIPWAPRPPQEARLARVGSRRIPAWFVAAVLIGLAVVALVLFRLLGVL